MERINGGYDGRRVEFLSYYLGDKMRNRFKLEAILMMLFPIVIIVIGVIVLLVLDG